MGFENRDGAISWPAIVAIPARNEADRIGGCLAALATQRDGDGAPLSSGSFAVLVFANNCDDGTAEEARHWARLSPHHIEVVSAEIPATEAHAGGARRTAMDLALERLSPGGLLMTTDADSRVAPTWVTATLTAIAAGADAVAGYIDAEPAELVGLGPTFLHRGRLEDRYLRCIAEIDAICDPRPHNPWPTHRVSSGASLALTQEAYQAVGGLPTVPVGEDIALTRALERAGFKVRHSTEVAVITSCRFEGRAAGGAADTMRDRHVDPDLPCGDGIEPALQVVRRAILKGRVRRAMQNGGHIPYILRSRLHLPDLKIGAECFPDLWERICASSPVFVSAPLRPSQMPPEIERAEGVLRLLRRLRV